MLGELIALPQTPWLYILLRGGKEKRKRGEQGRGRKGGRERRGRRKGKGRGGEGRKGGGKTRKYFGLEPPWIYSVVAAVRWCCTLEEVVLGVLIRVVCPSDNI